MSSLIRKEGAISRNMGVINPRSHSIRRHAQFAQRAVYWVNKQGRQNPQLLSPFSHASPRKAFISTHTSFKRIVVQLDSRRSIGRLSILNNCINVGFFFVSRKECVNSAVIVHICISSRKTEWTSAKPSTRLNHSRAHSMNQPLV